MNEIALTTALPVNQRMNNLKELNLKPHNPKLHNLKPHNLKVEEEVEELQVKQMELQEEGPVPLRYKPNHVGGARDEAKLFVLE